MCVCCRWGSVLSDLSSPTPQTAPVAQTYWLMGLVYEWSHFIVHTRVRPGTKLGRAIKEHHTRYGAAVTTNVWGRWGCDVYLRTVGRGMLACAY